MGWTEWGGCDGSTKDSIVPVDSIPYLLGSKAPIGWELVLTVVDGVEVEDVVVGKVEAVGVSVTLN
jgi:hypothetical protein